MNNSTLGIESDFPMDNGLFRNPSDLEENPLPDISSLPSVFPDQEDSSSTGILTPLLSPQIDYDKISQSPDFTHNNTDHFFRKIYFNPTFHNVALLIVLIVFILWVIIVNCLTIVGLWKTHKKGHVVDLYLANLAFGDVLLGILILPLITVVFLLGYFPFSSFVCDAWVFVDYYLIVASSYGFTALMCNYLWMIRWPHTFPMDLMHHVLALVLTWTAVNISWTPPFFNDRLTVLYPKGACGFAIFNNQYFSFYIGMSGFYIPLALALICGIWSLAVLKRHSGLPLLPFGANKFEVVWDHRMKNDPRVFRVYCQCSQCKRPGNEGIPCRKLYPRQDSRLGQILSHHYVTLNSRGQTYRIFKSAKAHYPLVVACFLLFISTRGLFYVYFGIGSFVHHLFPTDISNGVYWVMHSNAAISPLLHFWFDPELRKAIQEMLGIKKKYNNKKESRGSSSSVSPAISNKYDNSSNHKTLDESGILPSVSIMMGQGNNDSSGRSGGETYEHFLWNKRRDGNKEDLAEVLLERSPKERCGRGMRF